MSLYVRLLVGLLVGPSICFNFLNRRKATNPCYPSIGAIVRMDLDHVISPYFRGLRGQASGGHRLLSISTATHCSTLLVSHCCTRSCTVIRFVYILRHVRLYCIFLVYDVWYVKSWIYYLIFFWLYAFDCFAFKNMWNILT